MSLKFDKGNNFITLLFHLLFEAKIRLDLNRFLRFYCFTSGHKRMFFFTKLTYLERGDMLKVKMMKNEI